MNVIAGLVEGPFTDEAAFKAAVLKVWDKRSSDYTRFQIENEEKEPGMPDVLSISGLPYCPAHFTEFKITDAEGAVTFRKTQPLFYKRHSDLRIEVLVWDVPRGRVVRIMPQEVVAAKTLRITIPEEVI